MAKEEKLPRELQNFVDLHDLNEQLHVYKDPKSDFWLVNRDGIRILRQKIKAYIKYEKLHSSPMAAAFLVTGTTPTKTFTSTGEANPDNLKINGKLFPYPVAMAEKRGEARVVLELAGMYEAGFRGEEEMVGQQTHMWDFKSMADRENTGKGQKSIDNVMKKLGEKKGNRGKGSVSGNLEGSKA